MVISFSVPGKPQGKARARTVRNGEYTHSFTPEKTVLYENLIKECAMDAAEDLSFGDLPISLRIEAWFQIPKSWSKRKKHQAELGIIVPGKPDADNIAKVVMDAINGILWTDDKQVFDLSVTKQYLPEGEDGEHIFVRVSAQE